MKSFSTFPSLEQLEHRVLLSGLPADLADATSIDSIARGSISADGVVDATHLRNAYRYVATASGVLQVDMDGQEGLNSRLEVLNAAGRRMEFNDNAARGTLDSKVRLRVQSGKTYFIRVTGGVTSGGYQLVVTSFPTDDYGDLAGSAKKVRLARNGSATVRGTINFVQDVDMLAVVARQTGMLQASLRPSGKGNTLMPELAVYNAEGQKILAASEGLDATGYSFSCQVVAGQTYYIRAAGGDSTGRYTVRLVNVSVQGPNLSQIRAIVPDGLAAGDAVLVQVMTVGDLQELIITGSDGADTITVAQLGGMLTVTTPGNSQSFADIDGLVIATFGGDDTIKVTYSVQVPTSIDSGDGNDRLYYAGQALATLESGNGNDLFVSIGTPAVTIRPGGGLNNFWIDADDTITSAGAQIDPAALHRVSSFYQPYTSNKLAANYIPVAIAGQNLSDPQLNFYADHYANFSFAPLFSGAPAYSDISQGAAGDCYFMATLASLAQANPTGIQRDVTDLGDGTYAVRFYRSGKPVYVRVDADLPVTASGALAYADLGKSGALWGPIMEKAYAFFHTGGNSYSSLNGGWMEPVYREMTNMQATTQWPAAADQLYILLDRLLSSGSAATLASRYDASSPVIGSHAYMVKSVQTVKSVKTITVYNPWGIDGRGSDSNPNDGLVTLTLDQVTQLFDDLVFSAA